MVAPSVFLLHGHRHHLLASLYCHIREDTPMAFKVNFDAGQDDSNTLGKKILPVLPGISADDAAATYLTYGGISLQRPQDLPGQVESKQVAKTSLSSVRVFSYDRAPFPYRPPKGDYQRKGVVLSLVIRKHVMMVCPGYTTQFCSYH